MTTTETGAIRSCLYSGGQGRPVDNRLDLIFKNREGLEALAEALGRGMDKYGRDNWQKGFKESVLVQHSLDHLIHYVNGTCEPGEENVDQLSGAIWNIFTLCWVRKHKPELLDLTGPDPGPKSNPDNGCSIAGAVPVTEPSPRMIELLQAIYDESRRPSSASTLR